VSIESAYQVAKAQIERSVELWDWDEDVDLIGLSKLVILPHM
jgi:hypothetical protein